MKNRTGWILLTLFITAVAVINVISANHRANALEWKNVTLRAEVRFQKEKIDQQREDLRSANSMLSMAYPGAKLDFITVE